jgi:UDP-N-acetylglucosamine 2-epimerase
MHEIRQRPTIDVQLIHTGQHHSPEMSKDSFGELDLPEPDLNLAVSQGTPTEQTAIIMTASSGCFSIGDPTFLS